MDQILIAKRKLEEEITSLDDETLELNFKEQLQLEYNCQSSSELALAKIASINYICYLNIQEQIKECISRISALYYSHETCRADDFHPYNLNNACKRSQFELLRLNILSKESERAYRHYINAINILGTMKQPAFQINIKTNTAVISQNQQVQTNPLNYHA